MGFFLVYIYLKNEKKNTLFFLNVYINSVVTINITVHTFIYNIHVDGLTIKLFFLTM